MSSQLPTISEIGRSYLRLHLCRGVGPIRSARLIESFGDIDRVLGASVSALQGVEGVGPRIAESIARDREKTNVDAEIELAARKNVRIICREDSEYPELLMRIPDPPSCIYIRGTIQREDAVGLGIVGSRHGSHYGIEQAERFAVRAAAAGMTVHSGMARGVDTAAHRGALTAHGRTIAVLGCGLAHLYPPDAIDLADQIAQSGCLMSELPMNVAPDASNFQPRNRIIAGLSLGVLVVEAAHRSGALGTARHASDYNREVFAIPGRVDIAQSEGCHELIRIGAAQLVTKFEHILDELGPVGDILRKTDPDRSETEAVPPPSSGLELSVAEKSVFEALDGEPMSIEAICERSRVSPGEVAVCVTMLQLKGLIRRTDGDLYFRAN